MKVLHIIDSLGLGGAQTVVKGIFEAQKENEDIFLFALRKRDITTEIKHKNVCIFDSRSRYSFAPIFALRKLIQKEKIDIIQCHLYRSNVFGIILKTIWFPHVKLIVHEHGGIFEDGMLYRLILNLNQKKVDCFIAISKSVQKALMRYAHVNESKITLLYNFVDLNTFSSKNVSWHIGVERTKLGISSENFIVGFAGRLVERKGWREFVEAARLLSQRNENISFLIAGEGEQKKELLALITKYALENKVIYLGHVSNMVWFYSLLDCFVVPSHWEPMGLTGIEAQAMEVPIIASNVDGLNEIVKNNENGILFDSTNFLDLSLKIKKLSTDSLLRKRLSLNAFGGVGLRSLNKYIKDLKYLYEQQ